MSRDRSDGGGFICVWRSLREHRFHFTQERRPATHQEALEDLWQSAAWQPQRVISRDQQITVERGQVLTSVLALAARWRWTRAKVRTFLGWLVDDQEIAIRSTNRRTIITVCNYAKWQDLQPPGRPAKSPILKQQTDQQIDHVEPSEPSEPVFFPELVPREKSIASTTGGPGGFEEFWKAYPRKVGKTAARRVWDRDHPPLEQVLAALAWQIHSDQWTKDGGEFIPHPATYLNQGRYLDERSNGHRRFETKTQTALRRYWEANGDLGDLERVRPALPEPPDES